MDLQTRFSGKTVVITGAGGNFGKEGCFYFLRRGARVAAVDKIAKALQEVADEVKELQSKNSGFAYEFETYECDVTNVEQVSDVVDRIVERFERIDMLWNNAGYQGQIKTTLDYDPVDFGHVMNINVTGMFVVLQAVARKMAATETGGTIVNTASVAGLRGTPGMVAYSSSKAAVFALTVATAKDLAPHGIRVNAVSPAFIGPGFMWERQNELHAASGSPYYSNDPKEVAKAKLDSIPMKRLGSMEEVVKTVAFLLSDESSYTTGANLVVDGGVSG
jgi:NAD(P)-dependent dehydrogenase (short-subunit alcohol dehydrogenase family)